MRFQKGHKLRLGKDKGLKAALRPSIGDLQWAAGFLEGEGSFTAGGNSKYPCERVMADQVQLDPLQKLQRIFGGRVATYPRQKKNQQDLSKWTISGSRARGVMLTLYTLMSPRRKLQIREALFVRK